MASQYYNLYMAFNNSLIKDKGITTNFFNLFYCCLFSFFNLWSFLCIRFTVQIIVTVLFLNCILSNTLFHSSLSTYVCVHVTIFYFTFMKLSIKITYGCILLHLVNSLLVKYFWWMQCLYKKINLIE